MSLWLTLKWQWHQRTGHPIRLRPGDYETNGHWLRRARSLHPLDDSRHQQGEIVRGDREIGGPREISEVYGPDWMEGSGEGGWERVPEVPEGIDEDEEAEAIQGQRGD